MMHVSHVETNANTVQAQSGQNLNIFDRDQSEQA